MTGRATPGDGVRAVAGGTARAWTSRLGWAEVAHAALDLVIPQACAGCARPGRPWCATCAATCRSGTVRVAGQVPCRAAAAHGGPAGRAVVAYKDGGVRRLARPLSELLAMAVRDVLADAAAVGSHWDEPVWLVPIPSRPVARRQRGGDPVGVLAARAARHLRAIGVPANRCSALVHVRGSRDQVGLSGDERRANVACTMRSLGLPAGQVVVVDDVTTTGATIAEAARALAASGPHRVPAGQVAAAVVTWSGRAAPRVAQPWALAL